MTLQGFGLPASDFGQKDDLDIGLAQIRDGLGFVTLPARVAPAAAIVAAAGSEPVVAWSTETLTLVGIGVAHELRASGPNRWSDLVTAARALPLAEVRSPKSEVRLARFLGGLAFTPGAADRAPWSGFGDAWFVLPRWTYVREGDRAWLVLAVDARDARSSNRWHSELAALRGALAVGFAPRPQPPMVGVAAGDPDVWRAQVRAITDAIARGECEKVVAARAAVVTLAGEPRFADLLAELDARHAECARVIVRPPGGGTLIAATPERLVRVDGTAVACDALAGSRARTDAGAAQALLASAKDRREHDLVVRAIAHALRELDADVSAATEPAIRTLRHLLHLHTPISARLRQPQHVLEVAARLHPTPAVGGTPTQLAVDWIARHEREPRGWYAAPVGWFDLHGNGELAVAIRSGLVAGDRAHLWAGAGIVAGSDPDRELAETDDKLRAMLGALGVAA